MDSANGRVSAASLWRAILGDMKTPKHLSREAMNEFKAAYKEEFGVLLTDDQVKELAIRLLRFFGILADESPREK